MDETTLNRNHPPAEGWLRRAAAIGVLLLATACGGGGGGGDGPDRPIPARAGSAEIGPDGGSVDAVLEGGATVEIDVPKGALKKPVTVRIEPEPAGAGQLGAFRVRAKAAPLLEAATLVVTLPSAAPDSALVLHSDGQRVAVGEPPSAGGRRLVLALGQLGVVATPLRGAAAGRKFALDDPIGDAVRDVIAEGELALSIEADQAFNDRLNMFVDAVNQLVLQPTVENALVTHMAAESLVPAVIARPYNASPVLREWGDIVCREQRFAVNALNGYDGVDVVSFRRLVVAAVTWTKLAIDRNALVARVDPALRCARLPADHRDPLRARLPSFRERLERALNLIDARSGYDQLYDVRLPELFAFEEVLQQFDAGGSILDIIGRQTSRLRNAAWADCRASRQQGRQIKLIQLESGSATFAAASPFEARDLRADYQLCGVPLSWELRNSVGQVLERGSAGGIAAGQARRSVSVLASGAESLVLRGPLRPLHCGATPPQINNEDLLIRVGPEVGDVVETRRLVWADEAYLAAPLTLDLEQLRATAATIASTGAIRVELIRDGALCPHALIPNLSAHEVLVTLVLDFASVRIETASLPEATVGAAYSRRVEAVGGQPPYTWSARDLPPGLAIDPATGTIAGTPTDAGAFNVLVEVRSAQGASASRRLGLAVRSAVLVSITRNEYQGARVEVGSYSPNSGTVGSCASPVGSTADPAARTWDGSVGCTLLDSGRPAEANASLTFAESEATRGLTRVTASGRASVSSSFYTVAASASYYLPLQVLRPVRVTVDVRVVGNPGRECSKSAVVFFGDWSENPTVRESGSFTRVVTLQPGSASVSASAAVCNDDVYGSPHIDAGDSSFSLDLRFEPVP